MTVLQCCFAIFLSIQQLKQTEATHNLLGSLPLFASQYPNVYVYENGNLTLPCSVDNESSTVNYTWFRGDQELPEFMVNGEGSLVVPNITEGEYASREGVDYYCIARDNIGFDVAVRSRTITVFYTYFDGFKRMAESGTINVSISVALDSEVALECDMLDAKPPLNIKWYNDQGPIQEETQSNSVRFLDGGRYLYLARLQPSHLEQQYYCAVTNVGLNQEISAPTRYVLTDNLAKGVLMDYKQIGNLTAFVGNTSIIEFAYVGGVFGNIRNGTANALTVSDHGSRVLRQLGNIGRIDLTTITSKGVIMLMASVRYNGMITVRRGTLTIHQVPRITSILQNEREHFTVEENLMYTCEFEGSPLPRITFYFNGRPILTDTGVRMYIIVNNTLIIPSPQVSHSGIYQCIVSNEFGDNQRAWLLEIREPILPQVEPYNVTALGAFDDQDLGALIVRDNGSTVSFSVTVVADPCPDIVWFFNGTRLGPSNETFLYNNACAEVDASNLNWKFTLSVLLTADTSGSYTANLTNIAGSALTPKAYFTLPESVLIIGLFLNETCLKEGSTISLHCVSRGFPRPRIEFLHNDHKIIPDTDLHRLEDYDQILITNVTLSAAGTYTCVAISGLSSQRVIRQFDFCTVPVIVSINLTPNPQFGDSFFIECTVDGIPMPVIRWTKDGALLDEITDSRIRISVTISSSSARKSSLVEIFEATSSYNGVYECNASNIAGSASTSFRIEHLKDAYATPHILQTGDGDTVPVPLSLGIIVGITVGVIVLVSAALFVVLVLVCVLCHNRSSRPEIANIKSYSANVAHTGTLGNLCSEVSDPIYNTLTFSDHAKVRTNEKARVCKRGMPYIYERVDEDIELTEQPSKDMTIKPAPGNAMMNISAEEIQVSDIDSELPDPLYDTVTFSDPAKVRTNCSEKAQIHIRGMRYIYERVDEDIELAEQPSKDMTNIKPALGNAVMNISMEENQVSRSDTDDKDTQEKYMETIYSNTAHPIESSHNEDNGKQGQRSLKIESQVEQETTLQSDPMKLRYLHPDHKSEKAEGSMIKEDINAAVIPNDDANKDIGKSGAGNDDKPPTYAFISAEHKAKKRKKMLQKQQKEDQNVVIKMEEGMEEEMESKESKKAVKEEKTATERHCIENEKNKVHFET